MKLVIIESPYAGDTARNLRYLRACMRDCLLRGESPYASHALYTQPGVLRDEAASERALGIQAGFAWRGKADLTAFYTDLGWSRGMRLGLENTEQSRLESRELGPDWEQAAIERERMGEASDHWTESMVIPFARRE